MTQTKTLKEYKAKITEIFSYEFPGADGGVYIYEVSPSDELPLVSFYVASLDDTSVEMAWGVGDTPEAALETAAREWDRIMRGEEEENPFREVKAKWEKAGGRIKYPPAVSAYEGRAYRPSDLDPHERELYGDD